MRLDKFLKESRIIKRRTVAKEASDNNLVTLNGKIAKPSLDVKEGDVISVTFKGQTKSYKVETIKPAKVNELIGKN